MEEKLNKRNFGIFLPKNYHCKDNFWLNCHRGLFHIAKAKLHHLINIYWITIQHTETYTTLMIKQVSDGAFKKWLQRKHLWIDSSCIIHIYKSIRCKWHWYRLCCDKLTIEVIHSLSMSMCFLCRRSIEIIGLNIFHILFFPHCWPYFLFIETSKNNAMSRRCLCIHRLEFMHRCWMTMKCFI